MGLTAMQDEWAIEKNRRAPRLCNRAASLPHMILPLLSALLGLSSLIASVRWINEHGVEDPQFGFIVGVVFTVLGGWELRFLWRRLRGE
jgi:hypothetical protein